MDAIESPKKFRKESDSFIEKHQLTNAIVSEITQSVPGIVENMGPFKCPHCNEIIELFQ